MKKSPRIGVIIPAFNEASVIEHVLLGMPRSITHHKQTYEIVPVVINDGSTDNTGTAAKRVCHAVVIDHLINTGAGGATRTGLRYIRENDFAFGATMDADGQHEPADLLKVLKATVDGAGDVIIGNRLADTAEMSWYKILGNKGLNVITKLLLGVGSTDSQSGLKGFSRKTIEKLDFRENGYAFCSEMLWRASQAGLVISEVPVRAIYTDYSKGKGQSNWNALQIIKQLVKHRLSDFIHE